MVQGDEVYFVVDSEQLPRAMAAFGHEEPEARRLLIFGGGNIGLCLAGQIEEEHSWVNAKVIEANPERAEYVAGELRRTTTLPGSSARTCRYASAAGPVQRIRSSLKRASSSQPAQSR